MQHLNGRLWVDKGLFPLKRDLGVTRVDHNLLTDVHLGCFHTDVPISVFLVFCIFCLSGGWKKKSKRKQTSLTVQFSSQFLFVWVELSTAEHFRNKFTVFLSLLGWSSGPTLYTKYSILPVPSFLCLGLYLIPPSLNSMFLLCAHFSILSVIKYIESQKFFTYEYQIWCQALLSFDFWFYLTLFVFGFDQAEFLCGFKLSVSFKKKIYFI